MSTLRSALVFNLVHDHTSKAAVEPTYERVDFGACESAPESKYFFCGRVAQLGEHLLCKLTRQLQTLYCFLSLLFISNNLGICFSLEG